MARPILIVEDNPDDSYTLLYLLKRHRVANPAQVLNDGLLALQYLQGVFPYVDRDLYPLPALLFLDIHLPGKSGYEILEWLRSQAEIPRPVVIMHTQITIWSELRRCRELGADGFLLKQTREQQLPFLLADFTGVWEFAAPMFGQRKAC